MNPMELKTRREALGLTQEALAKRLDANRQAVARWEVGMREPRDPVTLEILFSELEDAFLDLVGQYIMIGEDEGDLANSPEVEFRVYRNDEAFAIGEPDLWAAGISAAMHRMAVAQARLELIVDGYEVRIVEG